MSEEENKALVRRFIEEVYNRRNLDVADELLAPDFVAHDVFPGEEPGIEGYKRGVAGQQAASSDLHFSIEEQIAEGDKVVTRIIGGGTHDKQAYRGSGPTPLAPTGARITIENITINRVVEGKIVEERNVLDASPLWQQRLGQETCERERVSRNCRWRGASSKPHFPRRFPH